MPSRLQWQSDLGKCTSNAKKKQAQGNDVEHKREKQRQFRMKFIDAHHHLWDLSHCHYPWLMAVGVRRFFGDPAPIQKNYLSSEFAAESDTYTPVASVHVQVGVHSDDEVKETDWLQTLEPYPQAIVAATDLTAETFENELKRHLQYDRLRGFRQIIGRHKREDSATGSDKLLDNPRFIAGLKVLAEQNLSFDLQMIPEQMPKVLRVINQVPELRVALCHCGSPWDQDHDGLAAWRRGLKKLANYKNVSCKVSGLGMFNPNWQPEDLRPIILDTIEIFGTDRVMFGSNFPVDKLYNSYQALWKTYDTVTASCTREERQRLFFENAAGFYSIQ